MKNLVSSLGVVVAVFLFHLTSFSQTPTISYVTPQVYTAGTAITTLSPTSTNVSPLGTYGAGTVFSSGNSGPQDVAFDAAGNFFVTELGNNTIRKFNSSGTFVSTIGTGLSNPYAIAIDASNNDFVISGSQVLEITSAGVQSTFIPLGLSTPLGIAVDAAGNVYVANNGSAVIQKYNAAGVLVASITAPLGLDDVTLDASGNIYALSKTLGTITEFDPSGTLISTLTPNVAGLPLSSAGGITIDASGNLFVADSGNNRILEYQGSTLVSTIPTGAGTSPRSVDVDLAGRVYVSLNTTNAVNKFVPTGGYFINQPLPAGLNFDNSTGNISGTPTVATASAFYMVTAYNATGNSFTNLNITVNPALGVSRCGAGSVTLTAPPGSPAGGNYKWYPDNITATTLQNSSSNTYTANIVTTTTYYVSYKVGGVESARTAVTATINPIVSSPYTGAYFSYPFTGNANDVSGNNNNGVLTAAPALTADRYGNSSTAYGFNGSTQYISSSTAASSPTTFTISLWFNTTTAGGKLMGFGNAQTGASTQYDRNLYLNNSGQLYFGMFNNVATYKTINTAASYNDGNWHHVIVTVSPGGGTALYVDGTVQASSATMLAAYTVNPGYWRIGYDALSSVNYPTAPTNLFYKGTLDDIAVYNRVLSAAEIASSNDLNQIGISATSICPGSPISFTAPTITGATYTWKDPQGNIQTAQNPTFPTAYAGNYYLTVTGGPGSCSSTAVVNGLTINPVIGSPIPGAAFSYSFTGNANDVSGNLNNGIIGGATLTADRYGAANSAYLFNGTSNYITTTTLITNPTVFTMSLWFKTTTSSGGLLLGLGNTQVGSSTSYDRVLYMSNSGQLYFGIKPNIYQTINTAASYNDGNWHHVVVTFGTDGSTMYVDDFLQASNAGMTVAQNFNGYWRIGYNNLGSWPSSPSSYIFGGTIDDIAVYTRELSLSEIGQTDILNQIGALTKPVCAGTAIKFSAPLITGATYTWKDPSGATLSGAGLDNPTFASALAGNYTVTVTGGPGGCTSSATITPTLTPLPSTAFSVTPSVDVNVNATVTLGTYDPTSTYNWNFNGGTPATGTGQGPFSVQWSTAGTKTITLTVTNSGGCFSSGTQPVEVNAVTYSNYAFRRLITLNNAAAGISSTLSNFPVLLSIQSNDLIISGTCTDKVYNPNGPNYDFAFVDGSSSNELYYQIESYNKITGTLLVWVQVPSLSAVANNTISFYYGAQIPPVTHNAAFYQKTWTSDYKAVYHFNDAAFTGTTADATSNGNTASLGGFTAASLVPGKIGNAYNFGGSNNMTATPATVSVAFTLSAWINVNTLGLDQKVITNQGPAGLGSGGYKLGVYTTNIPECEDGGDYNRGFGPDPTPVTAGTWYYIQGVYDGSTLSTYVNGVQYKLETSSKNITLVNTLYIGVGEGGQYPFNGIIDEPRVSSVAKSGDWLKMEYFNQNNPVAFTTTGATANVNMTNAAALPGALTYTWTGATSTDPAVATNWTNTTTGVNNQLPANVGTATMVIPSGLSNYPVLTADLSIYGLTLANGATLSLNGHNLAVGCNIYNSNTGLIQWNNNPASTVTWNGSLAAQSYNGSALSATAQLGSMTVNNSAGGTVSILGGPLDIYNTLTMTTGKLAIGASPAALTLKSDATTTARVAPIPAVSTITGTVNVERYISGGLPYYRGYRLLSSPVNNGSGLVSVNYLKNSIFVLGTTGAAGGFDVSPGANNPTLYLFRENLTPAYTSYLNSNFIGISNINTTPTYSMNDATYPTTTIPVASGYLCFFRGSRATASPFLGTTTPLAATVTAAGVLNQGQIVVKQWFTASSLSYTAASPVSVRGFNLVGNPYASAIDWETFQTSSSSTGIYGTPGVTGVNPTIWVLDPKSHNYGAYIKGGAGIGTNNASNIIVSGQGFFVIANSTSDQIIFNESAKSSAQPVTPALLMGRPDQQSATAQYLRLQLAMDSVNTDDILLRFNSTANASFNANMDAPTISGFGKVSLASISGDHVVLAINTKPFPKTSETIPLRVNTSASGVYSLNMLQIIAVPKLFDIWLMDAYKKDSVDMRVNPRHTFDVLLTDTNTYGAKRFTLVIRQNTAYAYRLLSFAATKVTSAPSRQVNVLWHTENEQNYTYFTVERSTDGGKTFNVIGIVPSSNQGTYSFLDNAPVLGNNLYRLEQQDINGNITYSSIITVSYSNLSNNLANNAMNIYPNPVVGMINVMVTPAINSTAIPSYNIQISNSLGLILRNVTSTQQLWQTSLSDLLPGNYVIRVVNSKDKSLVGEAKFVKL